MKIGRDGVIYFARYESAQKWAEGLGLTRIIGYGLGWAIQLRVSGSYVGPREGWRILTGR